MIGRRKSGIEIINKHVDKFQNIIDGLGKGISKCREKEASNKKVIETLLVENESIKKSREIAVTFKDNLRNMLRTPNPNPK